VAKADEDFRAGRRDEGAAALVGLLDQRGVGHATLCHHLGLRKLADGDLAGARVCLERAGEAGAPPPGPVTRLLTGGATTAAPAAGGAGWRALRRGLVVERRYRLEGEVGRGGMASVYRAAGVDRVNKGRLFALKVPAPGLMADDRTRERFLQEIAVSERLS